MKRDEFLNIIGIQIILLIILIIGMLDLFNGVQVFGGSITFENILLIILTCVDALWLGVMALPYLLHLDTKENRESAEEKTTEKHPPEEANVINKSSSNKDIMIIYYSEKDKET